MKCLDRSTKWLGVFVIALGMYSFFLPMVIVDPPVMNRTEWSALDIAWNIYERKLPVRGGMLDWGPGGLLDMALIYVLMTFSVIALYLPGPPKVLRAFGAIGFVAGYEAKWWSSTFLWLFGILRTHAALAYDTWHHVVGAPMGHANSVVDQFFRDSRRKRKGDHA